MINHYRIKEAKRIIEECVSSLSVFDGATLFTDTGFNSAVSFFRAFKLYTGLTPKEYANETSKEVKNQDLKST